MGVTGGNRCGGPDLGQAKLPPSMQQARVELGD